MAMMDVPLNAWLLFGHASRHFADTEVVTRRAPGDVHRYTYADFARRAQQLMHALDRLGVAEGERVATLSWNSYRHLECYFAFPCAGRVLHTLNLRLPPAELGWISEDADDQAPLGLSYTSGTTGRPKGVVCTHRSAVLHSLAVSSGAGMSIGPQDCVLPVVPMFHANAWGMPHAAVAVGAKQVFLAGPLNAAALAQACAVRGPWVADGYWKGAGREQYDGGWFRTGDVAIGSPDGYFVIADRSKDLIKSGGEWTSSVDMEADIMAMPQVAEAAVVAMPDPRWQERPLAFVVASGTDPVTLDAVRGHLESLGWAKWQLPDRVEPIERIPVTSTGKFDKKLLRARLARPNAEGRSTRRGTA